jgi:DNA-directed RNA polymerase subunit RPC12/RpoP
MNLFKDTEFSRECRNCGSKLEIENKDEEDNEVYCPRCSWRAELLKIEEKKGKRIPNLHILQSGHSIYDNPDEPQLPDELWNHPMSPRKTFIEGYERDVVNGDYEKKEWFELQTDTIYRATSSDFSFYQDDDGNYEKLMTFLRLLVENGWENLAETVAEELETQKDSQPTAEDIIYAKVCPKCHKILKNSNGVKIHLAKAHRRNSIVAEMRRQIENGEEPFGDIYE